MTPRAKRLTGCSQVFGPTLQSVNDGNVQTYVRREGAIRACREYLDML